MITVSYKVFFSTISNYKSKENVTFITAFHIYSIYFYIKHVNDYAQYI